MMTWAFAIDSVPFTADVIAGKTSLGGSESACLGLARALVAQGHAVHVFTSKLGPDCAGSDASGLVWHPIDDFFPMNEFVQWDVFVGLRWYGIFGVKPIQARMRILWNQDLMVPGNMVAGVMSCAWSYDELAYVSQYHRDQWEDLQKELSPIGWVTRNGIDLSQIPQGVVKDPNRVIHISRPERGLGPLLKWWPALKALHPQATLRLCRYSSMYDDGGWGQICRAFDVEVERVNAEVGGITYLGELNKVDLYREISEAAVMWYPGVVNFAETNCIAATEANACGTPFVGSLKGALVETARPSYDAGLLIPGDAVDDAYGEAAVAAVSRLLDGCANQSVEYRRLQRQGREWASTYDYATLAREWVEHVEDYFDRRLTTQTRGVLRQLIHEDDYVAVRELVRASVDLSDEQWGPTSAAASRAADLADDVIHSRTVTAEDYATDAIQDPIYEAKACTRFHAAAPRFEGCSNVLDVACGNGAFAISLAMMNPTVKVHGIDYSGPNIAAAKKAAETAGFADRVTFERVTVYDFDRQEMHGEWYDFKQKHRHAFDGMFVGEFIEHVAKCDLLVDSLETAIKSDAKVVYTCPSGAFCELRERRAPHKLTHVHRFHHDDVRAVFGAKKGFRADYMPIGQTARGVPAGVWLLSYRVDHARKAGPRPIAERVSRTRPMPKLTVGVIACNAENDLGRCLHSVWQIADEIIVGDTGSSDRTAEIAKDYGATVLQLAPIQDQPDGFAGARNAVLAAATGDWFLWIDTDEVLAGATAVRPYLDGAIFNGFVIHQNHLQLDAPQHHDIPVRVFRTHKNIQFYGCVHEQPQMGDANSDIHPTLDATDVQIAHTGYLTEGVRQDKMLNRNMPLIIRDQQRFPDRLLGKVILLRESVTQAMRAMEQNNGQLDPKSHRGFVFALTVFREHFSDPGNKYHAIARPWYEASLKALNVGWEVEVSLAGRKGGLENRHAKPERIWVADDKEFAAIIAYRTTDISARMRGPEFHADPFHVPEPVEVSA